jgi:hypothetical protein
LPVRLAPGGLADSGWFADFDSRAWTATVNYGDGTGDRPLSLEPDRGFALDYAYRAGDVHRDGGGADDKGEVGTGTLTVTLAARRTAEHGAPGRRGPGPICNVVGTVRGRVAVFHADVNRDGVAELIVAERRGGRGGRVYDATSGALLRAHWVARRTQRGCGWSGVTSTATAFST